MNSKLEWMRKRWEKWEEKRHRERETNTFEKAEENQHTMSKKEITNSAICIRQPRARWFLSASVLLRLCLCVCVCVLKLYAQQYPVLCMPHYLVLLMLVQLQCWMYPMFQAQFFNNIHMNERVAAMLSL